MKELTAKYAIEKGMSAIDCVKWYNPDLTDNECDFILWEKTCFPMNTDIWLKQLHECFIKS